MAPHGVYRCPGKPHVCVSDFSHPRAGAPIFRTDDNFQCAIKQCVDAAFLDPPYNVRIGGHAVSAGSHREFAMASGEMSEAEFRSFLSDTLGAAARVSRDGAVHFVCMDWRHMDDVSAVGRRAYAERLNLCIWNKSNAGMGSLHL